MKPNRYQVTVNIQKVELSVKFPCSLQIMWKRGNNKCISKIKEKNRSIFNVNESLVLDFHLYANQSKKSQLVTLLNVDGQSKLAGVAIFTISDDMPLQGNCQLPLEKSPDSNAKICFTYTIVDMGESDHFSDSRISEISSQNQRTVMGESFGLDKENVLHSSFNQKKVLEQQKNNSQLQGQLKVQSEELKRIAMEKQRLKSDFDLQKELYEKCLKDVDLQKQSAKNLQNELKQLQEKVKSREQDFEQQQVKLQQFKNENEYLDQQYNQLQKDNSKLMQNLVRLDELDRTVERVKKELEISKNQNSVLETKYQHQQKRCKQLEEKLETNKTETSTNTNYYEIQEIVEKDHQLKDSEHKQQEMQRKIDKFQFENSHLKNQINKLEAEINQYKNQNQLVQSQCLQQKLEIQNYEQDKQQLQEKIQRLDLELKCRDNSNIQNTTEQQRMIQNLQHQLQQEQEINQKMKEKYSQQKSKTIKQAEIIEQLNEELNGQSVQFLRELQILTRKQEQLHISSY